MPDHDEQDKKLENDHIMDPLELVYSGGYEGNPREIVENPAVAPQTLNEPDDLRDDTIDED